MVGSSIVILVDAGRSNNGGTWTFSRSGSAAGGTAGTGGAAGGTAGAGGAARGSTACGAGGGASRRNSSAML